MNKIWLPREDAYSLLLIATAKPQYFKYCELVNSTGQKEPAEAHKNQKQEEDGSDQDLQNNSTYCQKLKSFLCCRSANLSVASNKQV